MKNEILLSFAIPTYNRSFFLKKTLDSIRVEIERSINYSYLIEIVVCDNYSTDSTLNLLEEFKSRNRNIIFSYYINSTNIGPEANFIEAVNKSRGKYCVLFGSDDVIIPGSIEKLIRIIEEYNPAIILSNRININNEYKILGKENFFAQKNELLIHSSLISVIRNANSIGGLFSYISTICFKTTDWMQTSLNTDVKKYINTGYYHAMIFAAIAKNKTVITISSYTVYNMTSNDSFYLGDYFKRVELDFNYLWMYKDAFPELDAEVELKSVLIRTRPFSHLLKAKAFTSEPKNLYIFIREHYGEIMANTIRFIPASLLRKIYSVYQLLLRVKALGLHHIKTL